MLKLDKKDIQILSILQQDGRIAKTALAERVNLSPTPCWERLKRLEKAGIIEGYAAFISWTKLGFAMTIFMEAEIDNHHAADFERFEQAVMPYDEILECWAVSGGLDYFLKIAVKSMDDYQTLVGQLLNADIGLKRYQTYVVTRRVKANKALPESLLNNLKGQAEAVVSCQQHDYIEIACLYHLRVELKLNDGSVKIGVAQTTQYNADKQECLVIDIDDSLINVDLNELISMHALEDNPHFGSIYFKH